MDKQTFIIACINITTIHAFPFSSLECEGITGIIKPIKSSLNLTVNSHKILPYINNAASYSNKKFYKKFHKK